jgi:DNA-binding MarR family transcriptional regulator
MATNARAARRATLTTLLLDTAHRLVDELVSRLAAAGYADIRPAHSRVFENLDPEGTRLTELARRARMTQPSMTELVAGLEASGYLARRPDPTDGRARLVMLTPAGRALQRLAVAELAAIEGAWLDSLGPGLAQALPAALEGALTEARAAGRAPGHPPPRTR